MPNLPNPPSSWAIAHDPNCTWSVGLFTNTDLFESMKVSDFTVPTDPNYSSLVVSPRVQLSSPNFLQLDFQFCNFSGKKFKSNQLIQGVYIVASYANGSVLMHKELLAAPFTLGPGTEAILVRPTADFWQVPSTLPINP